jgi:hypothetical protein
MNEIKTTLKVKMNKPENLDLYDLIKPHLPHIVTIRKEDGGNNFKITDGRYLRKQIPAMYHFIHILIERQYSKNMVKRCRYNKNLVKMYSRDIEPFKSKNDFRLIWSILYQLKVIDYFNVNEATQYKKSAKAYYFGFTEQYKDSRVINHEIEVRLEIHDRLNKLSEKSHKVSKTDFDFSKDIKDKQNLHQYLSLRDIRFDAKKAMEHAEYLLKEKLIDTERYNSCFVAVNNINDKKFYFTRSPKCNRVYTNVTGMPREIRPFITDAEGESLTELDFGSFNAFAVYRILNMANQNFPSNIEKIAFENEFDLYRRILSGGDFYSDFKAYFFPESELTREVIKDVVLQYWFNARLNSRNRYRKMMLMRLPKISAIIDSLKVERYSDFSNFVMSMESELVNDIIYLKFMELYPDAVVYTIFDSFLVEKKHAAFLQSLMLEEGSKFFKLNCIVRAK